MGNRTDKATFDSWKEIAVYLKRTEKTCRRWEKELGLPIHRLEDSPRARVFAFKDEIDAWREKTGRLGSLAERRKTEAGGLQIGNKRRIYRVASLGIILVLLTIWFLISKRERQHPASVAIRSVAVLPFEDLSPGKNQEHLAKGMTDALINALCNVPGLRVPAETPSFFLKAKNTPLPEIGRLLHADALIEGSIQVSGETIRLTVQLVSVEDGSHLWSEKYDRPLDDIFALQDEIARAVIRKMEPD
jgi:TolB-like protein